jgi:hypothetical protein
MVSNIMRNRPQYDLPTAVTFLIAGLGIGSLLAILFSPRSDGPAVLPSSARRGNVWQSSAL